MPDVDPAETPASTHPTGAAASEFDDDAAGIDRALSETQRLEREERNADIARQVQADENLVEMLSQHDRTARPE